jgi:hypothetical protein
MPMALMTISQGSPNSDGLRAAPAGGVRGPKRHAGAPQAAHRAALVAEDFCWRDLEAERDALALGVVGFHVVRRHLLAASSIGDRH